MTDNRRLVELVWQWTHQHFPDDTLPALDYLDVIFKEAEFSSEPFEDDSLLEIRQLLENNDWQWPDELLKD